MHESNVIAAWALAVHDALDRAAQEAGSGARELAALTLVAEHSGCSVDWLSRRVGLTQSGTVRLVDRLVEQGMLERGASSGRVVPLRTTQLAEARLATWRVVRDEVVSQATAGLSGAERERLAASIASALEAGQRSRPQADATCRTCTWAACGRDCPVDRSVRDGS